MDFNWNIDAQTARKIVIGAWCGLLAWQIFTEITSPSNPHQPWPRPSILLPGAAAYTIIGAAAEILPGIAALTAIGLTVGSLLSGPDMLTKAGQALSQLSARASAEQTQTGS